MDGLWATQSKGVGLIVVQLVSKMSNLCDPDPSTSQTDRQTDRRTDDMQSQYRALHYSALRGKNLLLSVPTASERIVVKIGQLLRM